MTDFRALLETLADGGVEYVLVGGLAAVAHGSARLTQDKGGARFGASRAPKPGPMPARR